VKIKKSRLREIIKEEYKRIHESDRPEEEPPPVDDRPPEIQALPAEIDDHLNKASVLVSQLKRELMGRSKQPDRQFRSMNQTCDELALAIAQMSEAAWGQGAPQIDLEDPEL